MNAPPNLRGEARAFAELKAKIAEAFGLDEEDEAVRDTVEGQSSLHDMILATIRYAQRRQAEADAMGPIIADNQARKKRHEQAADAARAAVAQAMEEAGLKKVDGPDMTISQRPAQRRPVVVEERDLPPWALQYKASPNRAAIKDKFDQLGDDFACPGVVVSNGEVSITVRTR